MRQKVSELLFEKRASYIHDFLLNEEKKIQLEFVTRAQVVTMLKKIASGFNSKKLDTLEYQDVIKLLNVPIAGFNMNAIGARQKSKPTDKISTGEFKMFFKKWDMIPFIIEDAKTDQEITGNIDDEKYHIVTFIPSLGKPISNNAATLAMHKEIFDIDKLPEKGFTYKYFQMKKLPAFVINDEELESLKKDFRSGTAQGFIKILRNNKSNRRLTRLKSGNPNNNVDSQEQ